MKKFICASGLLFSMICLTSGFELKFIDTIHQRGSAIDVYVVVNSTNDPVPPKTQVRWYVDDQATAIRPDGRSWQTAWTNTIQITNVAVGDMVLKKSSP